MKRTNRYTLPLFLPSSFFLLSSLLSYLSIYAACKSCKKRKQSKTKQIRRELPHKEFSRRDCNPGMKTSFSFFLFSLLLLLSFSLSSSFCSLFMLLLLLLFSLLFLFFLLFLLLPILSWVVTCCGAQCARSEECTS